jgi:hypothetical protein
MACFKALLTFTGIAWENLRVQNILFHICAASREHPEYKLGLLGFTNPAQEYFIVIPELWLYNWDYSDVSLLDNFFGFRMWGEM